MQQRIRTIESTVTCETKGALDQWEANRLNIKIKMLRRSIGNFVTIKFNKILGRSYAPKPRNAIFIETSGRCNLGCRFCAYPKRGPLGFLNMEQFVKAVEQASSLGIRQIWLTPMLGEVFADQGFLDKLDYLEKFSGTDSYAFYTNFILCNAETIRGFQSLKKLSAIHISIYGHDQKTFGLITQKPVSQYNKLMKNLASMESLLATWLPTEGIHFSIRTLGHIDDANLPETEMTRQLSALSEFDGVDWMVADEYDNWGGTITSEDVAPLGINLLDGSSIYKNGACTLLFSGARIASDRTVHACACRDVDDSMLIGNLDDQPLESILSSDNPAFRKILEDQQSGIFSENCNSCSMYRSAYDHRASTQNSRLETLPVETAMAQMKRDSNT